MIGFRCVFESAKRVMFIYYFFPFGVALPFYTQSSCWFMGSVHTRILFSSSSSLFAVVFFSLCRFRIRLIYFSRAVYDFCSSRSKRSLCFCATSFSLLLCIDRPLLQPALLKFSAFARLYFCLSKRKKVNVFCAISRSHFFPIETCIETDDADSMPLMGCCCWCFYFARRRFVIAAVRRFFQLLLLQSKGSSNFTALWQKCMCVCLRLSGKLTFCSGFRFVLHVFSGFR